ncbi:HNH endonuclease signature motif containing protein [Klenkia marina]|nr:HNH endonuclease signature motif containing protein [Klenkia marina]
METRARLGVALQVAVVTPPPPSSAEVLDRPQRLCDVLAPRMLDDVACAGELQRITDLRARLDAYEVGVVARLADLRPELWEHGDLPGGPVDGWSPVREFPGLSEFFVDEVAAVLNLSRTRAHTVANTALVLVHQLPSTWHALADGRIDLPRARALVAVLGWQQPEVDAEVISAVEAEALAWAISGEGPYRLQNRTAALLLEHDAAAADRARKQAQRDADVQVRGRRDGLADLVVTLDPAVATACRDATDRYARMWKSDGDDRPIGQLRTLVAADLLLRAWDTTRPPVTAHVTIHAPLPSLTPPRPTADIPAPPARTASGPRPDDGQSRAGVPQRHGTVGGHPVTAAHLRQLLRQWSDTDLDDLHAPDGGSLDVALTDPGTGRLRAVVTEVELRRAAARGCPQHPTTRARATGSTCGCPVLDAPSATDAYRPTAAQRRFIAARDRGCRHPGCSRPAIWTDADHVVAHDRGGGTDCGNLCTLCRRHHRLKTLAPGWRFAMSPDGVLSVTTPSGVTRTTRPPGMGHDIDHLVLAPAGLLTRDDPAPVHGSLPTADGDPAAVAHPWAPDHHGTGDDEADQEDDDPPPF